MQTTVPEQTSQLAQTKKCPFCAEQIQVEAIKCRYCGEFLDAAFRARAGQPRQRPSKWYYSDSTLVIALCCLGPLALPLAWANPRYKMVTKIVISVAVVALTIFLCQYMMNTYRDLMDQLKAAGIQ